MDYKQIIDISLPLNDKTVIYPGTSPLSIKSSESLATKSVLSTITLSSHTATHIDAPKHADLANPAIDSIPLSNFIGKVRVVDFSDCKETISTSDIEKIKPLKHERLLFKTTNSSRGFENFYSDFVYLSSDAAMYLANANINLVGIDSWSIKKKGSTDNTSHTAFLKKGIPIVEGLNLKEADEGTYFLIVLPLRFTGLDGSPARAVLLR